VTKIEQGLQSNCPKLGDYFAVGNEVGWDDRHQIAERLGITGQKERNTLDRLKKHLWRDILDWTTADALPPLYGELGEALRRANPRQWREGNTALYATLQRATREYPRTIEEMAPLYEAVMHGCEAGLYREALNEVYRRRIQRGTEAFNTKKLGAIQAELAVLAGFFEQRWDQPVAGLTETEKGYVLHEAGYALRGLGRLRDAITPMKLSVEKACALKMWDDAALRASNSSGLHLSLGNLAQALEYARLSMQWAVRSGDPIERLGKMARLGDTLHQMGRWKAAGVAFAVAEEIQRAQEPGFPFLYSFWGFWYCDLLLGQGKYREVQKRARRALERAERAGILFDLALCHLILGRAELALSVQDKKGERLPQAAWHLDQAIDILRKASVRDYLPRALLARAELRRSTGELDGSRADLTDGFVIATSGQMLRHEADYHLGYAALYAAWGKKSKARANLAAAEALIGRMQYDRRKGSLHRLSAKLE
jgi:tetratricopeptide (TPR) repeat protein